MLSTATVSGWWHLPPRPISSPPRFRYQPTLPSTPAGAKTDLASIYVAALLLLQLLAYDSALVSKDRARIQPSRSVLTKTASRIRPWAGKRPLDGRALTN